MSKVTLITFVKDRPGHNVHYEIDVTKIDKELNWASDETFAIGINRTIEWYLESGTWCKYVQDSSYQGERL